MDFEMKYEEAERLIGAGEYEIAFQLLKTISENTTLPNAEVAEALNLQGVIISGFAPYLSKEDENGLHFYQQALTSDPQCISALLNIISAYSFEEKLSPSMHGDTALFISAFERLKNDLLHQLTDSQKNKVENLTPQYLQEKKKKHSS